MQRRFSACSLNLKVWRGQLYYEKCDYNMTFIGNKSPCCLWECNKIRYAGSDDSKYEALTWQKNPSRNEHVKTLLPPDERKTLSIYRFCTRRRQGRVFCTRRRQGRGLFSELSKESKEDISGYHFRQENVSKVSRESKVIPLRILSS